MLRFIFSSLRHYRHQAIILVSLIAVTTAIISGSFLIGDSVRHSLKQFTLDRLGKTDSLLQSGEGFFSASLSDKVNQPKGIGSAALLFFRGSASVPGQGYTLPKLNVVGIDPAFFRFSEDPTKAWPLNKGEVYANQALLNQLFGEKEIILRLPKPDGVPANLSFGHPSQRTVSTRLKVAGLADPKALGQFQIDNSPAPTPTLFMPVEKLEEVLHLEKKRNLMLLKGEKKAIHVAIEKNKSLKDLGIKILEKKSGESILKTGGLFFHHAWIESFLNRFPGARIQSTWLVNEIKQREKSTPYSMVMATADLALTAGESALHPWIAKDLSARVGDEIELLFYRLEANGDLVEKTHRVKVKKILSANHPILDQGWMPDFPGIAEIDSTSDWSPGFEIDLGLIRDKDEAYWDQFRGTPKLFISLDDAKTCWDNPFGYMTSASLDEEREGLTQAILEEFEYSDFSLKLRAIKTEAMASSQGSVNFSELFLSLSFFLILSLALLQSQYIRFYFEKRHQEIAILQKLGFPKAWLRRAYIVELGLILIAGIGIGALLSLIYNQALLISLATIWNQAILMQDLIANMNFYSLAMGLAVSFFVLFATVWMSIHAHFKLKKKSPLSIDKNNLKKNIFWGLVFTSACAWVLLPTTLGKVIAAMFLFVGMVFYILHRWENPLPLAPLHLRFLQAGKNANFSVFLSLAMATFMLVAVGGYRKSAPSLDNKQGPHGGFEIVAETTLPITQDALPDMPLEMLSLPMVRKDDASCLNINQIQAPSLVGVPTERWEKEGRFSITSSLSKASWLTLKESSDQTIPAFVDATVLQWTLKKKLGDVLHYVDRKGKTNLIKIAGTINDSFFQGNLLIDQGLLYENFPFSSGDYFLLSETKEILKAKEALQFSLRDLGAIVETGKERLARYYTVENTYLAIFGHMGILALLFGLIATSLLIKRNLIARKKELNLYRHLGWSKRQVRLLLFKEYGEVVFLALIVGALAGALAG